jgi:DNA-binding response OmpR family regulator
MTDAQGLRILVVEDDDGNRLFVRRFLEGEGYCVTEAADGPAALQAIGIAAPDAIIMDLGLPGLDGLSVLRRIRRDSGVPVIVLTGRDEEPSKLDGFDAGADDYVVKPFSLPELGARLGALLRRGLPKPPVERFEFDGLVVDVARAEVMLNGEPIVLRPKELTLLGFLASSPGRVFSRSVLLEHVWGSTAEWQEVATVTEHIRRVRTKLGERPDDTWRIETVRGVGYRFTVDA